MSQKKEFFKGLSYVASAKYIGIVISIFITSILARILNPEDYGVVAVATVFIYFFSRIGDLGLGPAIIQYRDLTKEDISSIFGFSFWIALGLSILFFFSSFPIADFYGNSRLVPICQILSMQIFFTLLNLVPNSLLSRNKLFKTIAIRNVSVQVACGCIAIFAAYRGMGVFSLLITPVLSSIMTFLVNIIKMRQGIRFIPDIKPLKTIYNFSFYQFLFGFVNYFNRNMDKLIIGKYINIEQLGYYEKSYRLMTLPVQNINVVMNPVLHPFLSDAQNSTDRLLNLYIRMTKLLAIISCLLAAYLTWSSRELILIVYGDKWIPAIICFKILSISVISQISSVTIGSFMQACKKTKVMFYLGTLNTAIFLVLLFFSVALFKDTTAVCISFVIAFILEALTSFYAVCKYCFGYSFLKLMKVFIKPLLAFITFIILFALLTPNIETLPLLLSFAIKTIVWLLFCFLFLQYFTEYKPLMYMKKIFVKNHG